MSRIIHGQDGNLGLDEALTALRALSEETRLRILVLLAGGELSVSDLTDILSQSQPRISRHLKLLVEAGLVDRHREGAWAFFRIAGRADMRALLHSVLARLDPQDPRFGADRQRLSEVRTQRAVAAETFFSRLAPRWDSLRSLHVSEEAVEAALLDALGPAPIGHALDLGTGTGRMLQLLAPRAERVVGLDASHAMLSVARANVGRAGLSSVELRQGDIYAPGLPVGSFDLVVIHQVLHYLDDPARALAGAARLLAPGGRIAVVDFAPHALEFLRDQEAHRRLGFAHDQVSAWLADAGLAPTQALDLPPPSGAADQLTVSIWLAQDRRAAFEQPLPSSHRKVA